MESEPARGRASLLTRARYKPWDSNSPLSALEDEPAGASASLGKRMGEHGSLGLGLSVLRSWIVKPPRRGPRLEPGRALARGWGAGPPRSAWCYPKWKMNLPGQAPA
jgi:hypothetical protein